MALRFDLVTMYVELLGVFVLILTGTFAFSQYENTPWIPPFVLLTAAVILGGSSQWKRHAALRLAKKTDDVTEQLDVLLSGGVWIVWLVYGVVFRDVAPLVAGPSAYVHGAVVVILVLLSHTRENIRREAGWSTVLLVVVVALLFIPHPDTVSQRMPMHVLFTKVSAFYVLFAVAETVTKLEFDVRARNGDTPTRADRVYARQIQIVQSAWILLSLFALLPIAAAQLLLLFREAHRLQKLRATTLLPTKRSPIGSEVGGVGVEQSRPRRHDKRRSSSRSRGRSGKHQPRMAHSFDVAIAVPPTTTETRHGRGKRHAHGINEPPPSAKRSGIVELPQQFINREFLDALDLDAIASATSVGGIHDANADDDDDDGSSAGLPNDGHSNSNTLVIGGGGTEVEAST